MTQGEQHSSNSRKDVVSLCRHRPLRGRRNHKHNVNISLRARGRAWLGVGRTRPGLAECGTTFADPSTPSLSKSAPVSARCSWKSAPSWSTTERTWPNAPPRWATSARLRANSAGRNRRDLPWPKSANVGRRRLRIGILPMQKSRTVWNGSTSVARIRSKVDRPPLRGQCFATLVRHYERSNWHVFRTNTHQHATD